MPTGNPYSLLDSRDLIGQFRPALQSAMERIWAPRISVEVPSDREVEELGWLGTVPVMRQWIGGRQEVTLNKYSLTLRNYPYEATVPIGDEDRRRDKTGQIARVVTDLAGRTATHWNKLVGEWITASEAGTKALAYDGQFFIDTDHNESGTNQTNDLTATEVPAANVATTTTLTTTEAADIITQTIAHMMTLTDDQGEPINQAPREVLIVATKQGHYTGLKNALGLSNLGTGSGNNNPLLAWQDYVVNAIFVPQRVTAADKLYFFFGEAGMGTAPFIRTEEQGVRVLVDNETFRNRREVLGVDTIRGLAYGMWQNAALVTLS